MPHIVLVFAWYISLSIVLFTFIHIVANGWISSFFGRVIFQYKCILHLLYNILLYMCVYKIVYIYIYIYVHMYFFYIFFIHLSVDGHLVCFPILAIVNGTTMYTGVHVSFWTRVFIFVWIYIQEWNCRGIW